MTFDEEMRALLGAEQHAAFTAAMTEAPAVSIKLNRRKCSDVAELGYGNPGEEGGPQRVAWCESGYYLPERPKFTLNPLLHAGVFYVQDASSMIYEEMARRLAIGGFIPEKAEVLDVCAAPGGKSTSLLNGLPHLKRLDCNEVMPDRARILLENMMKWGDPRVRVASSPTQAFAAAGERYDLVAVDAPCSGEGMMRKDADAREQWSSALIGRCAALQREILADAWQALRPGGVLIYSTCTFNRHEDEENLEWLVSELGAIPIDLHIPAEWGILPAIGSDMPAMRFMPHATRGEGLFAAAVQKPADGTPLHIAGRTKGKPIRWLAEGTPRFDVKESRKGRLEIPRTEWALSTAFPGEEYPDVELTEEEALAYLRHEALQLPAETPKGYVSVSYRGHRLGMVKNIGNRANNLYPAHWRIRMK